MAANTQTRESIKSKRKEKSYNMSKRVLINLGGTEYMVNLNDSDMAKEFLSLIPFDTSVSEYSKNHYWGSIPRKIITQSELKTSQPEKGGFYYADHLTALSVFYEESGSIAPYEVYLLGYVEENLSELEIKPYRIRCSVKNVME